MGSADPRAYSRNKRGIAGNLIWINFDRHALLNLFHKARGRYVPDIDETRPQFSHDAPDAKALLQSAIVHSNGQSIGSTRSLRPSGNKKPSRVREGQRTSERRRAGGLRFQDSRCGRDTHYIVCCVLMRIRCCHRSRDFHLRSLL
jgi:hypothetical protein